MDSPHMAWSCVLNVEDMGRIAAAVLGATAHVTQVMTQIQAGTVTAVGELRAIVPASS